MNGGVRHEKDQWDVGRVGGNPAGSQEPERPGRAESTLPVQELSENDTRVSERRGGP